MLDGAFLVLFEDDPQLRCTMASSLGKMASPLGPTKCISTPSRVSNFLQRRVLPGPPTRVTRDHSTLLDIKFQKALSVLGSAWNPGVGLLRKKIRSAIFEPEIDVFVRSSSGGAKCDRNTLESIYTN